MKSNVLIFTLALICSTALESKKHKPRHKKNSKQTPIQIPVPTQQPPTQNPNQEITKQPAVVKKPVRHDVEMISMEPETVLPCLQKYLPANPIVVEAGAYDGKDTKKMAELWCDGKIYAFEPVPENFVNLEKNTQELANVQRFQVALSDENGVADFYNSADIEMPDTSLPSGSLLSPKEHLIYDHGVIFNKVIPVSTVTLDDWTEYHGITHVDLLWLDMQGYELNMLKASPNILRTVKVIYTEVEFIEAYKGQYQYRDVKEFLESQGFKLVAQDFEQPPMYWFGNAVFVKQ